VEVLDGGAVLADQPEAGWAEPARARHAELVRRARHAVAHAALGTGDLRAAQAAAGAAVAADPFDEVAYRALMRAHDAAGEPVRALSAYRRLRATLRDELGVDPVPATHEVYVGVVRNQAVELPPPGPGPGGGGFVGREPDLARLAAAWRRVAAGGCQLLLIIGEAGIGKSRLANQAVRLAELGPPVPGNSGAGEPSWEATGGQVIRADCNAIERSLPLQPVSEALTYLVGGLSTAVLRDVAEESERVLATLVPDIGSILGVAPLIVGYPQEQWRQYFDAVATFLSRLSATRPMLLILDDLAPCRRDHPATTALPGPPRPRRPVAGDRYGAGRGERAGTGYPARRGRPGAAGTARYHCDHQARRRGRSTGACGSDREADRRTYRERCGDPPGLGRRGETGVPESLRTSVMERVRRADPQAQEVLRAAAATGPSFAPTAVAGLLDVSVPEAARRCERALSSRLITVVGNGPVVLDGVTAGAAALAAVAICPAVAGYLIAGHASAEPGARVVLDRLGQPALIDLGLRLGEGTGALLAVPLVQAAARVLTDMATLDDVLVAR
jgi:hypothetical protein